MAWFAADPVPRNAVAQDFAELQLCLEHHRRQTGCCFGITWHGLQPTLSLRMLLFKHTLNCIYILSIKRARQVGVLLSLGIVCCQLHA